MFNYVKMWCSTKNIFSFKSDILQNIAASNVKKGKYIFFSVSAHAACRICLMCVADFSSLDFK